MKQNDKNRVPDKKAKAVDKKRIRTSEADELKQKYIEHYGLHDVDQITKKHK